MQISMQAVAILSLALDGVFLFYNSIKELFWAYSILSYFILVLFFFLLYSELISQLLHQFWNILNNY
jgi:hypothetical protein